jgi:hypothetical protein
VREYLPIDGPRRTRIETSAAITGPTTAGPPARVDPGRPASPPRPAGRLGAGALRATAVLVRVAACQNGDDGQASGSSPQTSASTTAPIDTDPTSTEPTDSAPTDSAPTDSAPATEPEQRCTIDRLTIGATAGDSGMSHRSVILTFTNTGTVACRLHGYPGVSAINAAGAQIAQARRDSAGYLGGTGSTMPTVTIAPGAVASAMVETIVIDNNGTACTPYAAILVTPPDETRSTRLAWPSGGCNDLTIHPVVQGATGTVSR